MTEFTKPTFIYWKIVARAQLPMLMLHAGNISYNWDDATANAWPISKNDQPFGQLPVLLHNGRRIAQSGTIARYCARIAKLWPTTEDAWLRADMLIEHCRDIFTMMAKAKYTTGNIELQIKAWEELADKKYPEHIAWLVDMLGSDDYFGGAHPDAGDIAVFSVLNMAERAGIHCSLSKFPTLMEHSKRVAQLGTINEYLTAEYPVYFKSLPVEENMVVESS
jgi:glutathione S-transferase